MPIRAKFLTVLVITLAAVSSGAAQSYLPAVLPVMSCAGLAQGDYSGLKDLPLHVTAAAEVRDGKPAAYCRVSGYIEPKVHFEVRLPLAGWTQRYLQTGCGGLCGSLNIRVNNAAGCLPAERGEFALASTDMGHSNREAWHENPQQRLDFAYRGVHVTALAAKALIAKFYGQPPRYSYFAGCSDGGREALIEAQRFPEDFNGITAGAPAMNFITQNTFYHAWNARTNTDTAGAAILTADRLPILHAAALASCDALDGLKDGLIADPRACHFDPAVTLCRPGQDPTACLTAPQVDAARKIYQGAHEARGRQLVISGPQPGSELAWRGVFVPDKPQDRIASAMFAAETIEHLAFSDRPREPHTLANFYFDRATFEAIAPRHALYDATDPNLIAFSQRGGKLILWHGWSDPHISPLNTIAYFAATRKALGEDRVAKFARLYLFPGGYHCGGGDGPFQADLLSPLLNWVERGIAPEAILASQTSGRTRPVYPYPRVARYKGAGSPDEAANFEPAYPTKPLPETFQWLGSGFFTPGYQPSRK